MTKLVPIQGGLFDFPPAEDEVARQSSLSPDHEARQQALDVHQSFIVEAPAGSGKTGLLVQRLLKLLGDNSVEEPEQVLAITFTKKATAEMRDRVLGHLESSRKNVPLEGSGDFDRQTRALADAALKRDRERGWSLLEQPDRLHIRTIDSVCSEVARMLPVLSGSGGRLAPVEDGRPLFREAARRTLLLLGTDQSDPVFDAAVSDLLLHRDGNLADCETLIADMLYLRDQWGTLIPLTDAHLDDEYLDTVVLPRLQHTLEQAICIGLTELVGIFPRHLLDELVGLASEMADYPGIDGPSPIAICRELGQSPAAAAEHLAHWRALIHLLIKPSKPRDWRKAFAKSTMRFQMEKHHQARLKQIIASLQSPDLFQILCRIDSLPPARYPADQWSVAKSLFRVLSRALVQLQFVFAERGECDFTELTLLARTALTAESGPEDLASALGARLQHLLVDEMQDTSAGQYELLRLLTSSWDGHSQTVFLVGDPRQSIYLFRQARVESFLETMRTRRLGDLPLTSLRLTANFRSQQNLVADFNHNFSLVFPGDIDTVAERLPYSPVDSVLPPSSHAEGLVWHGSPVEIRPVAPEIAYSPAQLRQRQAKRDAYQIRRIVEHWLRKPLPSDRKKLPDGTKQPWRVGILVRNRNHLTEIVSEFASEKHGPRIPSRAVDITALADRQEILDLTALTRALLHPADRVAGLAILRAPWCGLSLADLHTLTGADNSQLKDHSIRRLMEDRGHLLGEESILRLQRVGTILEAAAAQRSRTSIARLVERAWRSLGGDTYLDDAELTNVRRFFRLLDDLEAEATQRGGSFDPVKLVDRMRMLYAEPGSVPPDQPSVELLTIHGAKGLEWDVVLVPALERSPAISRGRLLTWSELEFDDPETGAPAILVAPIAAKGEQIDGLTTWLKENHKNREAAERKRLFYVASTRAREELHLFAAPDFTSRGTLNTRPDSLLKSAWAAAEPQFDAFWRSRLAAAASAIPKTPQASAQPAAEFVVFELAAAAAPTPTRPGIQRLPLAFDPNARFAEARAQKLPYGEPENAPGPTEALFSRPEGSFAARSFGNVVHESLDRLARALAKGQTPTQILSELPSWAPSISALLRADGLPRTTVERLARDTHTALESALRDPHGLWLLSPHPGAASEFALTAWPAAGTDSARPASVRADRIFHGGSNPGAAGDDSLWIIDYKTSSHSTAGLEDFLEEQRVTYAPQLEAYARILAPAQGKSLPEVRLALYFPMIPRLVWWKPASAG